MPLLGLQPINRPPWRTCTPPPPPPPRPSQRRRVVVSVLHVPATELELEATDLPEAAVRALAATLNLTPEQTEIFIATRRSMMTFRDAM